MIQSIVNEIKKRLKISDKVNSKDKDKDWKSERLDELEIHRLHCDTLPFKIEDVKEYGFLAKVKGLYAYISFYRMPWKYVNMDSWIHVAPALIGKKFYCNVIRVDRESLSVHLDSALPQFSQAELGIGGLYRGWIIFKANYGLFIDIGYHFNWRCGSIVGLMHRSQMDTSVSFDDMEPGTVTEVIYLGENDEGKTGLSQNETDVDWALGIPQQMNGKYVWVEIGSNEDPFGRKFKVLGKYRGKLVINRILYPTGSKKMRREKNALPEGEIITCEVLGVDEKRRLMELKWLQKHRPEAIPLHEYSMAELLDHRSTINLLQSKAENDGIEKEVL